MRLSAPATIAISALVAAGQAATADQVTLTVNLDAPPGGVYTLTGQSSMLLTTTGGTSSGGQLDGVSSGGASIGYTEAFPPPQLTDYQNFGYFGRIITADPNGPADVSMVVALQPGVGIGQQIGDVFAGQDEATLVAALDTNDSPEFFALQSAILGSADSLGVVELPTVPRTGETLDLVAFIGGANGDLGVKVGDFHFAIVPEPMTGLTLLMVGVAIAGGRRRSAGFEDRTVSI